MVVRAHSIHKIGWASSMLKSKFYAEILGNVSSTIQSNAITRWKRTIVTDADQGTSDAAIIRLYRVPIFIQQYKTIFS